MDVIFKDDIPPPIYFYCRLALTSWGANSNVKCSTTIKKANLVPTSIIRFSVLADQFMLIVLTIGQYSR